MDLDQIQLNKHLCTYLRKRLRKTRNVLEDRTFIRRARSPSQQRALTEVDLVMKRAEDLESKCMCKQSSWLDAAITLADIKEEVLEIVLDLCFWTSMLKIAVADSDTEESQVVRSIAKAVKKHEDLLQKLLEEGSSLQKAASDDRDHLLAKLEKVKKERASRSTVDEYILSLYLWSRIKEDDRFAANVESKQLKVRPGIHLGGGASGHVSEVTWLQQKCALKVLKVVDEKEATILKGCNHPHIVRLFWYWEHHTKSHIVMEWMPTDLYTHIQGQVEKNGGKPFQLHVAIDIMLQIAKAMRYLHSKKPRKIVHRDLKTSNILVQPNINNAEGYVLVKLADFGTSKFYNRTETPSLQTSEKGTTVYAAPEVFKQKPVRANNTSKFPPKADVWNFAMVCSEILTGKMPFNGIPRVTLHDDIKRLGIRPDLPPDCPRDLHFCITSCWDQNPTKRPTFVEVCKMLKLAKAASLGITRIDVHKLLFSPNYPTLANTKNRLDLNMPLISDKPTSSQPWSSLLPKKFLHFGWTKRKTRVGLPSTIQPQPLHTTLYSYKELEIATNNFDKKLKLGEGGFGVVYKGVLQDGEQVAVKCLRGEISSNFSDDQFRNEVGIMGRIFHRNIVELKGYCIHTKTRFLVHEFVENGSLAETLFEGKGNHVMDWPTRQNICLEVANGLQYLHEGVQPLIIHRDIKASNILLDKDLHAKIADFDVARIFKEDETTMTQHIVGTMGYLAPEYATKGLVSEKIDIYSLGVLLLEIVSGRRSIVRGMKKHMFLIQWAYELNEKNTLLELVDSRLNIDDNQMILNVIHVGLLCVQIDPSLRPSMARVVAMLKSEIELENWENVKVSKTSYSDQYLNSERSTDQYLKSEGSIDQYLSSEGSTKIVENPNWTRNKIEWNSNLFENPMHDLSTISFKANQSREETTIKLAKCIMDIKGKEPMEEEDDILDRSLITYSENTIGVHYEAKGSNAPPPRQPFSNQSLFAMRRHQELQARMNGLEGKVDAMCLELKEMRKLLIAK